MKKFTKFDPQLGESVVLTDKAKLSLYKKSQNSGYSVDILEEVYRRGYSIWNEDFGGTPDSFAFDRVNSFLADGFAAQLDEDLVEACWKGYKAVGVKKKNGKTVPNCVPTEEAEKHSKNPDDPMSRFVGSDELTAVYKKDTPGYDKKTVVKKTVEEQSFKNVVSDLSKKGWKLDRTSGSHHIFKHPSAKHNISVPKHSGDLPVGTLNQIKKKSSVQEEIVSEISTWKKIKYTVKAVGQQHKIAKELPPDDVEKDKTYQKRTKGIDRALKENNGDTE